MAYNDTGERISDLRKARDLTQDQLAEMASLNRVTIAKYESGKIEPGAHALSRIADALEVSTDVLLGRTEAIPEPVSHPKTEEAQILAKGIDRLPKDQREQALNVVRAMFAQYQDYFEKKEEANEPRP